MKMYNWVFTLIFSRLLEQNGANHWCYANDRQHATTGHAPARATFLTESTRLSLSFPVPGIPSSDSPSPTFSYSHVVSFSFSLFFFFLFLLIIFWMDSLYSSIFFFRFVRRVLFNRNLQFLFVIPHHLHIILIHDLYLSNDFSIDS